MARRKRKPTLGRPPLGDAKRTAKRITINLSRTEHDAIAAAVARENAEIEADPLATDEDRKPATVASWIRDHVLESVGLGSVEGES